KGDRAVGAGDADYACRNLEVAGACLERLRRDLLQLLAELTRGALHADAARGYRGGAAGAEPDRELVGVTLADMHALRRQAELLCNDLGVRRLVPLPARLRADQDGDVAIGVEPDIGGLFAHHAADLDIARKANAANQALFLGRLGALWKLLPL